jgi:hypothetical protein
VSKETLAQWVSLSSKKALTEGNIKKEFSGTGIWPLNKHAVDSMLVPSQPFQLPTKKVPRGARESREGGLQFGSQEQEAHA